MRVAAIDVGTNSTRLLVAEERSGGFRPLDRRMVITRLGQGVDKSRALDPEAVERTLKAIAEYAAVCGEYSVGRIRVTGTSAVRDARNRESFYAGVKALTGEDPELLSGEREARTTFLGAVSDLQLSGPVVVIDIGGGSTELILGSDQPERLVSLDVGCVRLFERYLRSDPPTDDELQALRAEVVAAFEAVKPRLEIPSGARLIGVAGTVTQLAALKAGTPVYDPAVTHHLVMTHGDVRLLAKRLESLPFEKRRRIKGLEPGRVDVIVSGAEVLLCAMDVFDIGEVTASEKDILDGLVLELLKEQNG